MEDEEGSIEAGHAEEEGIKVLLHSSPIYPLPEAIKKMERSETVCRYCGVSYLIYHEFHQLHTQLAQLDAELQELRETTRREKTHREALELERLEWERALHLRVHSEAEIREKHTREELEEGNRDTVRALRVEFESKYESQRREVEEEYRKISEEQERQLRGELGDVALEKLRQQREELERDAEEREKVLSDSLQKANKNLEELRKNLQQLEERGVCVRQQQALRATRGFLRLSSSSLADVRGLLSQLTEAWQTLRSQMLQHSAQVFSALSEELQHSTVELQKMRGEKEWLTQQLMERTRERDEQLSQQEDSERDHDGKLFRLQVELEEKNERWLLCQQRCDAIQKQLSSWEHKEEQLHQKCCAAVEEVTQMRKELEKLQQEKRELTRERDASTESHRKVVAKIKKDFRQQLATELAAVLEEHTTQSVSHLRQQREEVLREAGRDLQIEREKNQMLLLQCRNESSELQQKFERREMEVQDLRGELRQEMRRREEERRTQDEERRNEEEIRQLKAQELSQAKAELELMTEKNAELIEEVASLQETVRRECEEREELTAALSRAQQELFGRLSVASHWGSSRPPPDPTERQTPPGNKTFHLHSQVRVLLSRSLTSPNTLRPSPAPTDKVRGQDTEGGGAVRSLESWSSVGAIGGGKRREGALPRLKASSTVSEVKHKMLK